MSAAFATVLSLFSAMIVAVIGHLLNERRNRRDDLAKFRLRAYTDFIHAASRLITARRLGEVENQREQLAALNDAKARICICADSPVVEALSQFWLSGGTLEKESEVLAFTRLCTKMRESLGNRRHDMTKFSLSDTLFHLEPSSFSFREKHVHFSRPDLQGRISDADSPGHLPPRSRHPDGME